MDQLHPLVLGAAIGTAFSVIVQLSNFLAAAWRGRRYSKIALLSLHKHFLASAKSLEAVPIDAPIYLRVARLRYCKTDRAHLPDDLQRFGLFSGANAQARSVLVMARNSDIFMEEIALRFDHMTEDERGEAMTQAKENIAIMLRFISGNSLFK